MLNSVKTKLGARQVPLTKIFSALSTDIVSHNTVDLWIIIIRAVREYLTHAPTDSETYHAS